MPGMTKNLQREIRKAENFLTVGQTNTAISEAMANYGYDSDRWAEGQALLNTAKEKIQDNADAYAKQLGATDDYNDLFEEVWDQAQSLAHICSSLFEEDTETLKLLGLHKRRYEATGESEIAWPQRDRKVDVFLPWARNLYQKAQENTEIAQMLADFGYPADRLQEEAAEVEEIAAKDSAQEAAKAEAQQSTVERDDATAALKAWISRGEKVAKIALKDKPQLLEALGIKVRR